MNIDTKKMEIRKVDATFSTGSMPTKFVGNAAVYNVESKFGLTAKSIDGPFKEILEEGCFSKSLATNRNIIALSNHVSEPSTLLGTTQAGTLRLNDTSASLEFEIDIPDTTEGKDLSVLIARGDIKGVSLGMFVIEDEVYVGEDGLQTRKIEEAILTEISLVINPAYTQPNVEVRSISGSMEECSINEVSGSTEKHEATRSFDMSILEPYDLECWILRNKNY